MHSAPIPWDGDLDITMVVDSITSFWSDHFESWQKCFADRGWELTKRSSFMAVAVALTGPRVGWVKTCPPWAETKAEAEVRGASQHHLRSKLAKRLQNDPSERVPCRGLLHLDLHIAEVNSKGMATVCHRPNGSHVKVHKKHLVPSVAHKYGEQTVRIPRNAKFVARAIYGHDPSPAYRLDGA
jgi:hypothetical protein